MSEASERAAIPSAAANAAPAEPAAAAPDDPVDLLAWAVRIGHDGVSPAAEAIASALRRRPSVPPGVSAQNARTPLEEVDPTPTIPPELAYAELTAAFCGRHPDLAMQWLLDVGLMARLLPELAATVAFSQEAGRRHKDVWEHTKAVVRQSVPRPQVRWAAVLHDIGKVPTRRFVGPGKVTFHGHAEEGARMFRRGPARRVAFPPAIAAEIEALILHHLRPGHYDGSWTDSAVRRFAVDMGPHLRDVLDLGRADITSKRPGKRQRCLERISELARRIREVQEADARVPPLPPGLGDALMSALGLPPGRLIGALRALLAEGSLPPRQEPAFYVDAVTRLGLLAELTLAPPTDRRAGRGSAAAAHQEAGEVGQELVAGAGPGEDPIGGRPADEAVHRGLEGEGRLRGAEGPLTAGGEA
ncbi:MAG: HDIG domain-containing protein [Nannocystaceae bacterium]